MAKKQKTLAPIDPLLLKVMGTEPRRSDLRKTEIIRAAIACIAEDGVENTSYDAIGRRLGIGRAHVAYYFKDKSELISTAIHYVIAKGQAITVERILKATTTEEKIAAFVESAFDWAADDVPAMSVYMLYFYYCVVDAKYQKEHADIRKMGADRVTALLSQDPVLAKKHSASDLERIGKGIQLLITGALLDLITTGPLSQTRIQPIKKQIIQLALDLLR